MTKSITIDLVVPEGVPLVSYVRETLPNQKNVIILMFVSSMEAGRQKEDSNSVPMVTGLTFVMTTHPPYGV
jgi:uncharacterized protein YdhG (YjbR/CyaY superfamily)